MGTASAQTLDQALTHQLANFCQNLRAGDSSNPNPNFGAELQLLCFEPPTSPGVGGASVSGGAAGSTQTGNAFVKRFHKRRDNDEAGKKNGGGASADASTGLVDGLNLYFSGQGEGLDRKITTFEDGYRSTQWAVTTGADYLFTPWMLGGVALNFSQWSGDFVGGGDFRTNSFGPTVYASFYPLDGLFTDVFFRYGAKSFERSRGVSFTDFGVLKASGTATSKSGGDELETGALVGYDWTIKNLSIGPRLAFNYRRLQLNGYTESGNTGLELHYLKDGVDSLQTSAGIQASAAFSTSFAVLIPQVSADWTHEFALGQRNVSVRFAQDFRPDPTVFSYQTERPDRDFFHVGGGLVAVFPRELQAYVNFEALLGHAYLTDYVGTVGIRLGFN
ncbi:autotransporter outer membrane beta-barrel domain-containing protein [Methylomonas sp. SURF-2]|uniref:Autotransporter outer membrane beta-barrel domain-containing protein n=1 Tax=Methylomonas subterranea TaxID=2952225 RepID=A0ABT1TI17_9GAMM|nr:autotransporter outer membrane beta-barrel domain-containing protein [Methylomonas sp. SURF-2]